jgi:hypothetical protein
MAIHAMAVKDPHEPASFNSCEVLLNDIGILISLLGIRNEALS